MLRIAHRLAAGCWNEKMPNFIADMLRASQVHSVVCDNIQDYILSSEREWDFRDIHGIVAPWPYTLYEWKDDQQTLDGRSIQQSAVFLVSVDLERTGDHTDKFIAELRKGHGFSVSADDKEYVEDCIAKSRWISIGVVINVVDGRLHGCDAQFEMFIDKDGVFYGVMEGSTREIDSLLLRGHALRAVVTNSFLNCKNVTTIDSTAEDAPPAKWQRRMKTPEIRYSRIKIDGFTSEAKTQGGGIDGHNKAWHICRGNFATYTDAKPLFGKYTGRYWRPQHVKGDKKHGEVHSTHEIARPNTQSPAPAAANSEDRR